MSKQTEQVWLLESVRAHLLVNMTVSEHGLLDGEAWSAFWMLTLAIWEGKLFLGLRGFKRWLLSDRINFVRFGVHGWSVFVLWLIYTTPRPDWWYEPFTRQGALVIDTLVIAACNCVPWLDILVPRILRWRRKTVVTKPPVNTSDFWETASSQANQTSEQG